MSRTDYYVVTSDGTWKGEMLWDECAYCGRKWHYENGRAQFGGWVSHMNLETGENRVWLGRLR
jgi:hypothetical protein